MDTTRKTQLVQDWGFKKQLLGSSFFREIFEDTGFIEIWSAEKPDVIQFFENGTHSHDYHISWSLFN